MALQLSVSVRNAMLDAIETAAGASAVMMIRSGTVPIDCASADTGTVLATINLPADWMAAASAGSKVLSGTWSDAAADANGTAGHFRVYATGGTVCHMQGSITATGGGGDLTLNSTAITAGDPVTITGFTLSASNA